MRWRPILIAALLVVLSPSIANAEPPTPGGSAAPKPDRADFVETNVVATDAGVTIYVGIHSSSPGSPASPGSTEIVHAPNPPACTATATNIHVDSHWAREGLQDNPDTIPYAVNCDDGYFGIAWVPTGAPGDPAVVVETVPGEPVDPLTVAESLLGIVPLPPIAVGANPGTGLVALPSWFWVDGYGGETLTGSETLDATTVDVEITPQRYEWTFGDGESLSTTSLGQPYPAESDIRHTYEQSSLVAGQYDVRLAITFGARYRVTTVEDAGEGGTVVVVGEWQDLEPVVQTFTRAYPVQQLQSVLTAGR